jgi:hypothetical protein
MVAHFVGGHHAKGVTAPTKKIGHWMGIGLLQVQKKYGTRMITGIEFFNHPKNLRSSASHSIFFYVF